MSERLETPAFAALSALLAYPSEAMRASLPDVETILAEGLEPEASDAVAPLIGELAGTFMTCRSATSACSTGRAGCRSTCSSTCTAKAATAARP